MLVPVLAIGLTWLGVLNGLIFEVTDDVWWTFVLPIPIYCGIVFGIYALFSIVYGVYSVKDDPKALNELKKDIQRAKDGLKSKGFKFD
ncbi:hypothetical protein CHUAL_011557 [Chamberlinius hualienensis]